MMIKQRNHVLVRHLLMFLIASTMSGCRYNAICDGDVVENSELVVVSKETIAGRRELKGPYGYKAEVAVEVDLPQKEPYRQFAETVVSEAVCASLCSKGLDKECCSLSSLSSIADCFFGQYLKDDDAIRNADWVFELKGSIVWLADGYMSYRVDVRENSCSGGFGIPMYVSRTWSQKHRRILQCEDVLNTEDYAKIGRLIARSIVDDKSNSEQVRGIMEDFLSSDSCIAKPMCLACDKPEALVSANFMLVRGGVVWTYNFGWLGSLDLGIINAFVPYSLLEPYLRDKSLVKKDAVPEYDRARVRTMLDYHENYWTLWH